MDVDYPTLPPMMSLFVFVFVQDGCGLPHAAPHDVIVCVCAGWMWTTPRCPSPHVVVCLCLCRVDVVYPTLPQLMSFFVFVFVQDGCGLPHPAPHDVIVCVCAGWMWTTPHCPP
jgi:hypothetical protein